ncbi:MAG: hypothetical protein ACKVQK_18425 [Burkholderiales bacterium]
MVVDSAFAGLGFSGESAKHVYPLKMFLPGSDLSPIEENIDKVIEGLTCWAPRRTRAHIESPALIEISGRDYPDALERFNLLFLRNLWSDGLPLVPPTEERVSHLLQGTPYARDRTLGKLLPRGGFATVEMVTVAAVMAGCRPEYMPVLIAAVEAILDPAVYHQHMNSTTGNANPAVVVTGPIARQIRLNSGYGCLGTSPTYPAGTSIGRAIRLLLQNVGGGVAGQGSMAIHGGPARVAALVFAEDEAGLPSTWQSFHTERGHPENCNRVTVLATSGATEVWEGAALDEREAMDTLFDFAGCLRVPYGAYWANTFNPSGAAGIVLMGRSTAQGYANLGWSKARIREYLWQNSMLPDTPWLRNTVEAWARRNMPVKDHIRYPMPIAMAPTNILLVVAGGEQSGHSYWLQVHGGTNGPATRDIALPEKWDNLLMEADAALGPLPAR